MIKSDGIRLALVKPRRGELMKTKRILLPFLAFQMTFAQMLKAQETDIKANASVDEKSADAAASSSQSSTIDQITKATNKVWEQFNSALRTAKISTRINAPTQAISKGVNLGGGYNIESNLSLGGKYSGVDVWEINASIYPELFGIENTTGLGVGFNVGRQITFIQQFNSRYESLVRRPYDPITKLPLTSDLFFKTTKNSETQQPEYIIKEGDFVAFRAPMSLALGKGFNEIAKSIGVDVNLSYVLSGEFDVHIFRMKNNQVRVKLMAIKDKTISGSVGVNLVGFNQLGQVVLKRLIDLNLINMAITTQKSDLFIADYIFNLNQPESRDLYDQFVGHKMRLANIDAISNQAKIANFFAQNKTTNDHLMGDLEKINNVSMEDQKKSNADKRIIRVSSGHNYTESESTGLSINLFRLLKTSTVDSKSISQATLHATDDHNKNKKYLLETLSRNFSYTFFWLWGEKDVNTTSLLLAADEKFAPTDVLGFQISRIKEDSVMSSTEYKDLQNRFNSILPEAMKKNLKWPNWNFSSKDQVNNVYVENTILFTDALFSSDISVSPEKIKAELNTIIKSYGKFKSLPMSINPDHEMKDPRLNAFNLGKYNEAYTDDWEKYVIPSQLAVVLNARYSTEDRYKSYQYLVKNVPLFSEINGLLLMRLVPENKISEVILGKLALSARGQTASEMYFPSKERYETSNIFRDIVYQTNFLLNRTYDLRNYMKEDGSIYSIDEIMAQRTSK